MSETITKKTVYEFAYLLRLGKEQAEVLKLLQDFGVQIVADGGIKTIELAYEIEKQTSAQFGFYHIEIQSPDDIAKMTETLNLRKDLIIRFLFVKLPSEKKMKEGKVVEESTEKQDFAPNAPTESLSNEKLEQSLEEILK